MAGGGCGIVDEIVGGPARPIVGRGHESPRRTRVEQIPEPVIGTNAESPVEIPNDVALPLGGMPSKIVAWIGHTVQQAIQTEMTRARETEIARTAKIASI